MQAGGALGVDDADFCGVDDHETVRQIFVLIRAWEAVDPIGCRLWVGHDVARKIFGRGSGNGFSYVRAVRDAARDTRESAALTRWRCQQVRHRARAIRAAGH